MWDSLFISFPGLFKVPWGIWVLRPTLYIYPSHTLSSTLLGDVIWITLVDNFMFYEWPVRESNYKTYKVDCSILLNFRYIFELILVMHNILNLKNRTFFKLFEMILSEYTFYESWINSIVSWTNLSYFANNFRADDSIKIIR